MPQVTGNPGKNRDSILISLSVILAILYLTSNIMATRIIAIFGMTISAAGILVFPLTYILGDSLTEIWGYKTARRVILLAFFANIMFALLTYIGTYLPYPEYNAESAEAYDKVFRFVPRILIASLIAFLIGELANAKSMEIIKIRTSGKHLWFRAIFSSIIGYAADSVLFVFIAFFGVIPKSELMSMIFFQYTIKIAMDICWTPLTYVAVRLLSGRVNHMAIQS